MLDARGTVGKDLALLGPQRKGDPGVHPQKLKKIDCKWCNQSYSWALFVNKKYSIFLFNFFFKSRVTPVFPEQFAAMYNMYQYTGTSVRIIYTMQYINVLSALKMSLGRSVPVAIALLEKAAISSLQRMPQTSHRRKF